MSQIGFILRALASRGKEKGRNENESEPHNVFERSQMGKMVQKISIIEILPKHDCTCRWLKTE